MVFTAAAIVAFAAVGFFFGDALLEGPAPEEATAATPAPTIAAIAAPTAEVLQLAAEESIDPESVYVWVPKSGSRYHLTDSCSGMKEATEVTLAHAQQEGFTPCKRCNPPS